MNTLPKFLPRVNVAPEVLEDVATILNATASTLKANWDIASMSAYPYSEMLWQLCNDVCGYVSPEERDPCPEAWKMFLDIISESLMWTKHMAAEEETFEFSSRRQRAEDMFHEIREYLLPEM